MGCVFPRTPVFLSKFLCFFQPVTWRFSCNSIRHRGCAVNMKCCSLPISIYSLPAALAPALDCFIALLSHSAVFDLDIRARWPVAFTLAARIVTLCVCPPFVGAQAPTDADGKEMENNVSIVPWWRGRFHALAINNDRPSRFVDVRIFSPEELDLSVEYRKDTVSFVRLAAMSGLTLSTMCTHETCAKNKLDHIWSIIICIASYFLYLWVHVG